MDRFNSIRQRFSRIGRRNSKRSKSGGPVQEVNQPAMQAAAPIAQRVVVPQGVLSAPVSPVGKKDINLFSLDEISRPVTADSGSSQQLRGDFTPRTDDGSAKFVRNNGQEGVELPHFPETSLAVEEQAMSDDVDLPLEDAKSPEEIAPDHLGAEPPMDVEPLSEEEQQAMREPMYQRIYDEVPEDYTQGPMRMVAANDGIIDCPALLLTFDFSQQVREIVRAQREYVCAARMATLETTAAMNFEMRLECEIANHESRMSHLQEENAEDVDGIAILAGELATLQAMHRDSLIHRNIIDNRLAGQMSNLQISQATLIAQLEDAYVFAQLVEPQEEDEDVDISLPEIDLQEAYAEYRARQAADNGDEYNVVAPLDTNRDHLLAEPLSPEEQAKQDLRKTYYAATERLEHARVNFDSRYHDRDYEEHARTQALQRGEEVGDVDVEAFDKRWFIRIHELTKEVLDAEAAVREAKTALLEHHVEFNTNDLESGFGNHGSNGYPMLHEEAMIKSAPRPKIAQWLEDLPEKVGTPLSNRFEGDEWDGESRSVLIDDSASAVPEDFAQRGRIAKWRKICGLE